MAAPGNKDQLIDLLQNIQLRKTIRPEDATRALRQYYRVQEQIRQLKEDIEILKGNQKLPEQVTTNKSVLVDNKTPNRKSSLSTQNTVPQVSPMARRRSSNNVSPRRSSQPGTRDSTYAERNERSNVRPLEEEQTTNGTAVHTGSLNMADKDKEIAKLRMQNAQLRVLVERRATSTLAGDKAEEKPKSSSTINGPEALSIKFPSVLELVGEYKRIYDQEWRSTYHDLDKHHKVPEEVVTDILAAIAKEAYNFCSNVSKQQFEDISRTHTHVTDVIVQPKYVTTNKDVHMAKSKSIIDKEGYRITRRYLREYRKALAKVSIPGLMELYESYVHRDILPKMTSFRVNPKVVRPYIHRLIEIVWLMCVTEPPIVQIWQRPGQLMNREQFTAYSKKGATIIHTVWPALLLNKDGELLVKGVCMVK